MLTVFRILQANKSLNMLFIHSWWATSSLHEETSLGFAWIWRPTLSYT